MDMLRINGHAILQGVEYENVEDELLDKFYNSHHASSSSSVQVPADSISQQQRQQQPQATSPSVPDTFAAPLGPGKSIVSVAINQTAPGFVT